MESCDVLVVGGGPGGSACAARLHAAGLDVRVLDRAAFPRDKPCAGWVTPAVFTALELEPEEYARAGLTLQPLLGFRTGVLGGRCVETLYPRPVSYGIRRCEFDTFLLRRSGARVRTHHARELRREGGRWIVDGRFSAPMIVGAGGHFCPVARHLDPGRPAFTPIVAQEAEFPLDARWLQACRVRAEVPELYFCPDLEGYGWCFRKGAHLNVGLGRRDPRRLPEQFQEMLRVLVRDGRIPARPPTPARGHAYLVRASSSRQVTGDGLLLVGDAAGLAYAESGEGIRPAVESGLLAASVLIAAAGDYHVERLRAYAESVDRRFGAQRSGPRLPARLQLPLGRWLLGRRWFARRVVVERYFLRSAQPAFA